MFTQKNILLLFTLLFVNQKEIVFAETTTTPLVTFTKNSSFVELSKLSSTTMIPITSTNGSISLSLPPKIKLTHSSINVTDENNSTKLIPIIFGDIQEEIINATGKTKVDDWKDFRYIIYNNKTGVPCTLSKMGITLVVPYKTENNTVATTTLKVPLDANVTGTCEENISVLTLMWKESEVITKTVSDGENVLTMRLVQDGDIFYVQYLVVSITLDDENFPNATDSKVSGNSSTSLRLFPTTLHEAVHNCNETQVQADTIKVELQDVILIAFNNDTDISARKVEYCEIPNDNINFGWIIGGIIGGFLGIAIIILIIHRSTRDKNSWSPDRK